jgi:hypothetical protein
VEDYGGVPVLHEHGGVRPSWARPSQGRSHKDASGRLYPPWSYYAQLCSFVDGAERTTSPFDVSISDGAHKGSSARVVLPKRVVGLRHLASVRDQGSFDAGPTGMWRGRETGHSRGWRTRWPAGSGLRGINPALRDHRVSEHGEDGVGREGGDERGVGRFRL